MFLLTKVMYSTVIRFMHAVCATLLWAGQMSMLSIDDDSCCLLDGLESRVVEFLLAQIKRRTIAKA